MYPPAPLSGPMIDLYNLYTWLHLYSTQPNRILSTLLPRPVSALQLTKQFVKKRNHEAGPSLDLATSITLFPIHKLLTVEIRGVAG